MLLASKLLLIASALAVACTRIGVKAERRRWMRVVDIAIASKPYSTHGFAARIRSYANKLRQNDFGRWW